MANIITSLRIVCALTLGLCPTFSKWFYILYIIAGISDVLDGICARYFGKETKLGAQLDTIADIIFTAVVLFKVINAVTVPIWLIIWTIVIAVIKAINIIYGFIKYKKFVSEHTIPNKACGIFLFMIPLCIGFFPWQPVEALILITCAMATFAAVQEGYYIRKGKEII